MNEYFMKEGGGHLMPIPAHSLHEAKQIAAGNQRYLYSDLFIYRRSAKGTDTLIAKRIHSDPSVTSIPSFWEEDRPASGLAPAKLPVLLPCPDTVIIYSIHRDNLIIATLREQRCTVCNSGVFRYESAVPATFTDKGKWLHRCSNRHCDETLFRFLCISLSRNMLYTYS